MLHPQKKETSDVNCGVNHFPFPSPTGPQVGQKNIFIPGNDQEKETQGSGFGEEQCPKQQPKYN